MTTRRGQSANGMPFDVKVGADSLSISKPAAPSNPGAAEGLAFDPTSGVGAAVPLVIWKKCGHCFARCCAACQGASCTGDCCTQCVDMLGLGYDPKIGPTQHGRAHVDLASLEAAIEPIAEGLQAMAFAITSIVAVADQLGQASRDIRELVSGMAGYEKIIPVLDSIDEAVAGAHKCAEAMSAILVSLTGAYDSITDHLLIHKEAA